ncbi:hypothetical protein FJT64_005560 [Amphibalanus amphitrite]|uniref:Uncharacterized protein n=1 Tax=Amphibalanus amphitrite TaxID=1232801 RepID=A0A6A4VTP4_AMPAM|nr:hypothetical protein FJT64_005560 [Amphibalanus amphitrite]
MKNILQDAVTLGEHAEKKGDCLGFLGLFRDCSSGWWREDDGGGEQDFRSDNCCDEVDPDDDDTYGRFDRRSAAGPLSEADLALLIGQLVNEQPNTAGWKQLLVRIGGSNATDESIVSHLCHRMALLPESPPPQPKDERGTFDLTAEPAPEVARVCACAVQLQRRNRPRLQALLRTSCREQLLKRRPELPPRLRSHLRLVTPLICFYGGIFPKKPTDDLDSV